ncbi:MAG: Wzz/FepE/Etk N-terminal domain-containing protein [Nitrospirota bacterium]
MKKDATLRDYVRVIFRHRLVIVTVFITVILTALVGLELQTPVYEAQVTMLVSARKETEAAYYKELLATKSVAITQSQIVMSNLVIERVVKALGLYQQPLDYEKNFSSKLKSVLIDWRLKSVNAKLQELPPEQKQAYLFRMAIENLKQKITVAPIKDTDLFTISVSEFHPVGAAVLANVVSRSYVIFDLEQQLAELQIKYGEKHTAVTQLRNYIEKLNENLDGKPLPDLEAIGPASVKIIEQAKVPLEPVRILSKPLMLIMAFFMSIVLGIMLAFGFEYFDQTFKSPQDVETFLNIPFLGSVPKKKSKDKLLITDTNLTTEYARAFHTLSDEIYLLMKDKNLKSLLVADAEESEETAAFIANLGTFLARKAGHKVIIIDANLRSPSVSGIFNISNSMGLADILEGKVQFENAVQDLGSNLYALPAGETAFNSATLLNTSTMSNIIKKAQEQYELVFINCTDLRNFADTAILSSITDGIAIVINEGRARRQVVQNAISVLEHKKINLIGAILNNRTYVIPKIIYKLV